MPSLTVIPTARYRDVREGSIDSRGNDTDLVKPRPGDVSCELFYYGFAFTRPERLSKLRAAALFTRSLEHFQHHTTLLVPPAPKTKRFDNVSDDITKQMYLLQRSAATDTKVARTTTKLQIPRQFCYPLFSADPLHIYIQSSRLFSLLHTPPEPDTDF